ncbi:MAG: hypothetical protein CR997_01205, partial [Acidobacteria bacterium]
HPVFSLVLSLTFNQLGSRADKDRIIRFTFHLVKLFFNFFYFFYLLSRVAVVFSNSTRITTVKPHELGSITPSKVSLNAIGVIDFFSNLK